jgi:hypothetical protein
VLKKNCKKKKIHDKCSEKVNQRKKKKKTSKEIMWNWIKSHDECKLDEKKEKSWDKKKLSKDN